MTGRGITIRLFPLPFSKRKKGGVFIRNYSLVLIFLLKLSFLSVPFCPKFTKAESLVSHAQWKETCSNLLSRFLNKEKFDSNRYRRALSQYRLQLGDDLPNSLPTGLEEKVALLVAMVEEFHGNQFSKPSEDEGFAFFVSSKTSINEGAFRYREVLSIVQSIFLYFIYPTVDVHGKIATLVRNDLVDNSRYRLSKESAEGFYGSEYFQFYRDMDIFDDPTILEKFGKVFEKLSSWTEITRSVLASAVLLHFGIPIVVPPDIFFESFTPLSKSARNAMEVGKVEQSEKLTRNRLNSVFKAFCHLSYFPSPLYSCFSYRWNKTTLSHIQSWFSASLTFVQNSVEMNLLTTEEMREFEESSYVPNEVVQQQLSAWIESRSVPPNEEEINEKRKEIEFLESQGVFRIYGE